jgi:hypothetical protein
MKGENPYDEMKKGNRETRLSNREARLNSSQVCWQQEICWGKIEWPMQDRGYPKGVNRPDGKQFIGKFMG